jgi:hypothetical protein
MEQFIPKLLAGEALHGPLLVSYPFREPLPRAQAQPDEFSDETYTWGNTTSWSSATTALGALNFQQQK